MTHQSVDLTGFLKGDTKVRKLASDSLQAHGWCFIKLSDDLKKTCESLMNEADSFFQKEKEYKKDFSYPPRYGYVTAKSRQGFRMLTGNLAKSKEKDLPKELLSLSAFCETVDSLASSILNEFMTDKVLPVDSDGAIPLLKKPKDGKPGETHFGAGLLDIVQYDPILDGSKYRVAPHADPGVFALSFGSTSSGLKMLNEKKEWISVPDDGAVLWCGATAMELTNGRIKPGWHRVDATTKSRLTMWYEVIAPDQVPKEVQMHGFFAYKPEIGRAVQQECRDRSRMPSSA
eukprot:TRINITY_DN3224_c0_g1_i5.p1 TRINITY_DN3224_c0_g1~~TRINITY_DN3224_c0_g1_i5.p1  ORF type:complete len:288 (+),score=32.54 TRINITY_DN3224_c0_g1_i5:60-923(+)